MLACSRIVPILEIACLIFAESLVVKFRFFSSFKVSVVEELSQFCKCFLALFSFCFSSPRKNCIAFLTMIEFRQECICHFCRLYFYKLTEVLSRFSFGLFFFYNFFLYILGWRRGGGSVEEKGVGGCLRCQCQSFCSPVVIFFQFG